MDLPPKKRVNWSSYHRIISSRFPPVDFFERISNPEDWDILADIESLTNPRIREKIGDISLIPTKRRVSGHGSSYVIAPFVHVSPSRPSRFSSGHDYGVFYGSQNFNTALYEVAYHRAQFYGATKDRPLKTEERVLKGSLDKVLHDIREKDWGHLHDPNDYVQCQGLAKKLRDENSNGIAYNSVRYGGGYNFAAFWPDVMKIPKQTKHLSLHWNGEYIDKYFDFETEEWSHLPKNRQVHSCR